MKNTYEKGQTYDFDGVMRLVIGFDGSENPITTTDLNYKEKPLPEENTDKTDLTENYKQLLRLIPLDKCKREELAAVAAYVGADISAAGTNAEITNCIIK